MIEAYFTHLLILICIYLTLAISLQLSMGFTGLFNLGHIAFYAIGAYASALAALAGWPFLAAFAAAGATAAIAGWILSLPTARLKGDYLALATLGFFFVVNAVALNWNDVTKGALGLPGIPKPEIMGVSFADNTAFLGLAALTAAACFLAVRRIAKTPFGNVLQAVRDDELAARSLGKDATKAKATALCASALFAGLAGSLYAHYITFIDPFTFNIGELITVLAMVIIGGLASLEGTVLAVVVLVLLPEPLRFIGMPSSIVGPARQAIYAAILLLILARRPRGFGGRVEAQ